MDDRLKASVEDYVSELQKSVGGMTDKEMEWLRHLLIVAIGEINVEMASRKMRPHGT